MDTSEEYRKMCDCSEIQGLRDGFSSGYIGELWLKNHTLRTCSSKRYVGGLWLPRQDQLQEMVNNLQTTPVSFMRAIVEWSEDPYGFGSRPFPKQLRQLEEWRVYLAPFDTHEKLLLAFVMRELHNKKWNGEAWGKED